MRTSFDLWSLVLACEWGLLGGSFLLSPKLHHVMMNVCTNIVEFSSAITCQLPLLIAQPLKSVRTHAKKVREDGNLPEINDAASHSKATRANPNP
ncbi:hypothetical protein EDB81DRAFT_796196 [Dactylonectria macrodidyma]|uniref:Uncharacterized protein n=1 Tax=Dactylonectria macrodidyma TaxID=307937 RepID=A0A9P9J6K4_9HYPO|nr:hypothetical protein EDB81DRAFT_796196 [Dactylonectria macrodidyma]